MQTSTLLARTVFVVPSPKVTRTKPSDSTSIFLMFTSDPNSVSICDLQWLCKSLTFCGTVVQLEVVEGAALFKFNPLKQLRVFCANAIKVIAVPSDKAADGNTSSTVIVLFAPVPATLSTVYLPLIPFTKKISPTTGF